MTVIRLLHDLKDLLTEATSDIKLPTSVQKGDTVRTERAPAIHLMRLPDSRSYEKIAPYIIIKFITGKDVQPEGNVTESSATIRFIFCVYSDNEEDGALMLVNLMETVRQVLLKNAIIGEAFTLDRQAGLESLVYEDDSKPYYAGEMIGTFTIPPIEREVDFNGW